MLNQETAKAARTDSGYILRAPRRMRVADAVAQYMRVSVITMTARMPSLPCSMYRKKKPSWITGRTLTATRAAR